LKPQIYKVGTNWILWVPGVRVYRFNNWDEAMHFALDPTSREMSSSADVSALVATNAN